MIDTNRNLRSALMALFLGALTLGAAADGQPVGDFPSWDERLLQEWTNRARSDPQYEMQQCPSGNCPDAGCYTPAPPLSWSLNLNRSARFQADFINRGGAFAHDNNCALRSDINALYPDTCNGDPGCSCAGSGSTAWYSRLSLFGGSARGENIALNYGDTNSAFYGWLHEPSSNSTCDITGGKGHRFNILTSGPALGNGVRGRVWVQDFGLGAVPLKIASGVHYPQQGSTIEFWANWYDPSSPALSGTVNIDGASSVMTRQRGSSTNGAWRAVVGGLGSGCHSYYFTFTDATGTYRYPDSGTFGIGSPASCPNWTAETAAPSVPDFNDDGKVDLVWRNQATGVNSVWFMDGHSHIGGSSFPNAGTSWTLAGSGDFNLDGHADLMWRNGSTGQNAIWFMDGAVLSSVIYTTSVSDPNWRIASVNDFDGDQYPDLLWRNLATGQNVIWYMQGATRVSSASLQSLKDFTWDLVGSADFDHDGTIDLLWRRSTNGRNGVWIMDGLVRESVVFLNGVSDTNWKIQAIADMDGDSNADLIWRNTANGLNAVWYMNGTTYLNAKSIDQVTDENWQIMGPK